MGLEFKLHVITSRKPLDWTSPRSLLLSTLFNHLIQDKAPIGHFFIEFDSQEANAHGVKKVLTGMSRFNKNESSLLVIQKKLGLGTFFFDFKGKLDHALQAKQELEWAKKRNRLKTILVSITPEASKILFDELDAWIRHGSFRHYGGGLQILKGEGSGCAEFGAHFLNLALQLKAIPKEWIRSVFVPHELIGNPKTEKKISIFDVFLNGKAWAKNANEGILYQTPDMDLTWNWMEEHFPSKLEITLEKGSLTLPENQQPMRISFEAGYPTESQEDIARQWQTVKF